MASVLGWPSVDLDCGFRRNDGRTAAGLSFSISRVLPRTLVEAATQAAGNRAEVAASKLNMICLHL